MKKVVLSFVAVATMLATDVFGQYEYKIVTTVESIVPGGAGRSRIIENNGDVDVEALTTERSSGKDSKQGQVKRKDVKIDELSETKLVNFYSMVGINFQNIASNDAVITAKLNLLSKEGWELAFVTSGVESDAGKDDNNGIFITRFVFRRKVQ
jgi:hypothetical protein